MINKDDLNTFLDEYTDSFLIITQKIYTCNNNFREEVKTKEVSVETNNINENEIDELKKYYLNNLISWTFLKKLSDFTQWPFICISNFIENSVKENVCSKNIYIDMNIKDSILSIKDDGNGISSKEFNQIFFSYSINYKKEYSFFKYGLSLKISALRLADSFIIISKTQEEVSIGLISKSLQTKYDTDYIFAPVINYSIVNDKYTPTSYLYNTTLKIIIEEISYIIPDIFEYVKSMKTGTHIFLYDMKKNTDDTYEMIIDNDSDILYSYFDIQIGEKRYIDCSLSNYVKFLFLKPIPINILINGNKVNINNPLHTIYNLSRHEPNLSKITSLKIHENNKYNGVLIEGDHYSGILYNNQFLESILKQITFNYNLESLKLSNGILIYRNNKLIRRFEQNKLGEISFFIKKFLKHNNIEDIFKISGYIELPSSQFELLSNKTVKYIKTRNFKTKLHTLYSTKK